MRSAIGIATKPTEPTEIEIPGDSFDTLVKKLFDDLESGVVNSRTKGDDWTAYAKSLRTFLNVEKDRSNPVPLVIKSDQTKSVVYQPRIKSVPTRIPRSSSIINALNASRSIKLQGLYKSLTSLLLADHPALLTAGSWVFFESLTALHGRPAGTAFDAYLSSKFNEWAFERDRKKELNASAKYIADHGNAEKHSKLFTTLNADNLVNHYLVLEEVIVRLINEASVKK